MEHPKSKSTKPRPRGHGTPCTRCGVPSVVMFCFLSEAPVTNWSARAVLIGSLPRLPPSHHGRTCQKCFKNEGGKNEGGQLDFNVMRDGELSTFPAVSRQSRMSFHHAVLCPSTPNLGSTYTTQQPTYLFQQPHCRSRRDSNPHPQIGKRALYPPEEY